MSDTITLAQQEELQRRLLLRCTRVDNCLIIDGWKDRDGYGQINFDGKQRKAHRAAFLAHNGFIDNDLNVLHECDTPDCCAGTHLRQGDALANMTDKVERNRQDVGVNHGRHKLTREQIIEIKDLYDARATNRLSCEAIAAMFNCGSSHVSRIGLGDTRFGGRNLKGAGLII